MGAIIVEDDPCFVNRDEQVIADETGMLLTQTQIDEQRRYARGTSLKC